jgi:Ca2+-transporting ATPase
MMPDKKKPEKLFLWALPAERLFKALDSSADGLTDAEAKKKLAEFGFNEIAGKEKRHGLEIFLSQFRNALVLVLIVAAILAYFLGEQVNAIVIIAVVLMTSVLGFFQEYKAEKTLRALKKFVAQRAGTGARRHSAPEHRRCCSRRHKASSYRGTVS